MSDINLDEVPPGVVNPLDHVNDEQKAKMQKLRDISNTWNLAQPEKDFIDEMCLFRFLSGLHWNLDIATQHLKETCEWRAHFKPQDITYKDVEEVAKQGYCFSYGRDKKFRPVVYLLLGKDQYPFDEKGKDLKLKNMVYVMEQCIKKMPKGVYNLTWVIDVTNANITMSLVKQLKDVFTKIGDYYTERLALSFVCNIPWAISLLWNFVKPFLAKETVAKYRFIKGSPDQLSNQLTEFIDLDQVPKSFGGQADISVDTILASQ